MLKLIDLKKEFVIGESSQTAVNGVSLEVGLNEFVILSGRSGSGKTTLLNMMGAIEKPDHGKVIFEGNDFAEMKDKDVSWIRRSKIGFIFQTFNLIPVLSAFENVEYPLLILGLPPEERKDRVSDILKRVGLGNHHRSKPNQLSGGQRQRVAIARSLVKRPSLVLADEPTANLDLETSLGIIQLIQDLFKQQQGSIVFCTHDSDMVEHGTRWLEMSNGHLVADTRERRGK